MTTLPEGGIMYEDYTGQKLCIFIGEDDKYEGRPLYEILLEIALKNGLSGGTVVRGSEGFGAHGEIHSIKILRISDNLPLILEFVGRTHKIEAYLDLVKPMLTEGLLTRTEVQISKFRRDKGK
jgi:PII-like signaling protein